MASFSSSTRHKFTAVPRCDYEQHRPSWPRRSRAQPKRTARVRTNTLAYNTSKYPFRAPAVALSLKGQQTNPRLRKSTSSTVHSPLRNQHCFFFQTLVSHTPTDLCSDRVPGGADFHCYIHDCPIFVAAAQGEIFASLAGQLRADSSLVEGSEDL